MKNLMIIILFAVSFKAFGQNKQLIQSAKVDKRIELVSIVFRLAGNKEYNSEDVKIYTDRIEKHFAPYKDHEMIQFARMMRNEGRKFYSTPLTLAVFLDDNLEPLEEIGDFSLSRWGKDDAIEFVRLLKQFYVDADCESFFKENQALYSNAVQQFLPVIEDYDLSWYAKFFGHELTEKFKVVIALGNGVHNYGISFVDSDGNKDVYAILGVPIVDNQGMPTFNVDRHFTILIHEFNHSFINHLLEKNKNAFWDNGVKIFNMLKQKGSVPRSYGKWDAILIEALVRAAVIKYYKDHDASQATIDELCETEIRNGFVWIKELVAELDKYDSDRATYPTLESYIPKLAEAYDSFVGVVKQYDAERKAAGSTQEN